MKVLLVYLDEDAKLARAITALKVHSPELEIVMIKADKSKTNVAEEVYEEYLNSDKFTEDIIIWHPDMYATKDWYEKLKQYYNLFDIIGLKLIYPNKTIHHFGGGIQGGIPGIISPGGGHPEQHYFNIGYTMPQDTAYVTGPGMIIKKHVWEKLKGWDYQFNYYIDADFCIRARKEGLSVGVVPVEIIHEEAADIGKNKSALSLSAKRFITKHMDYLSQFK